MLKNLFFPLPRLRGPAPTNSSTKKSHVKTRVCADPVSPTHLLYGKSSKSSLSETVDPAPISVEDCYRIFVRKKRQFGVPPGPQNQKVRPGYCRAGTTRAPPLCSLTLFFASLVFIEAFLQAVFIDEFVFFRSSLMNSLPAARSRPSRHSKSMLLSMIFFHFHLHV